MVTKTTYIPNIIIGGGPTGLNTATELHRRGMNANDILIIDQYDHPLQRWDHHNINTNRTADGHYKLTSLLKLTNPNYVDAYPTMQNLVEKHIRALRKAGNDLLRENTDTFVKGTVVNVEPQSDPDETGRIKITLKDGKTFTAEHVVLALGDNDKPRWPDWATRLREEKPEAVSHVFDDDFDIEHHLISRGHIVVLGAGRPAVEMALYLASKEGIRVTLISRNMERRESDVLIGREWFPAQNGQHPLNKRTISGSAFERFLRASPDDKHTILREARPPQINPKHHHLLLSAQQSGRLTFINHAKVMNVQLNDSGTLRLKVNRRQGPLTADQVLLTNFQSNPEKEALIQKIADNFDAPLSGVFPQLKANFEWAEGLYVTGNLSTMVSGAAPTLSKGKMGADEISTDILSKQKI